ncbi:toxin VasX [Pseudomonas abietaniphila]|uniref:toxin VasX n=1 Tax=Pseudomonas abietaniphila TaxID=89065 RepID=UPI000AE79D5C|nr:toxin VasX [Pseudomonas abietaniphila]
MTDHTLDKNRHLAAADQTAKTGFGHEELSSPMAACPARQPEIFVVPTRYAMAEQAAAHTDFTPPNRTQSHPMALRRLRAGYVSLWHGNGPLKRYAVATDGLLSEQPLTSAHKVIATGEIAGIALKKNDDAWMLFSERPLGKQACKRLEKSTERRQRMREVKLTEVAKRLSAQHCLSLDKAPELMAELMPKVRQQALAHDYQQNGAAYREGLSQQGKVMHAAPTPENIKAYSDSAHWLREREDAAGAQPPDEPLVEPGVWSATPWEVSATQAWLDAANSQSAPLYAVLAALDDDLGVLRDINHEQESVEARHEQWVGDNNLRLSIGGFVRSLITEDGAELAGTLSYRYKDRDLTLTPAQGKVMLDAQHKLDEARKDEARTLRLGGPAARDARIAEIVAPVRAFIPADLYNEAQFVVREYRAEKQANFDDNFLGAKVSEYIDLTAMNTWLDTNAPAHFKDVEQRHNALFADRAVYLKRSFNGTWFVDYEDLDDRHWLTEVATGCLTAQCIRAHGAEQYADYVRAADGGALAQLFLAWTPSLEAAINDTSRLGELMAALASDNIDATHQALAPLTAPILHDLADMAREAKSPWNVLVNRLAASLLLLKGDKTFSSAWLGIFVTARLGADTRVAQVVRDARQVWTLLGQKAEGLNQWARATGKAIGAGHVSGITNSPLVTNSGGIVPLAALLLNIFNTHNYLNQGTAIEGMDNQRVNDTFSASLYAAAALVAVIDSQVRVGLKKDRFFIRSSAAPTLTLFGGVIGALSFGAALNEYVSLQTQLENSQRRVDPWLAMRQYVVAGQVTAYGAQALLGLAQTGRALAGLIEVEVAIMRYTLCMGPLNWIIASLGVLYLITWFFQQTPLQNFLNFCCWSKARAGDLSPIAAQAQEDELDRLYAILYAPRVSMDSRSEVTSSRGSSGMAFVSSIRAMTIDLPGAEPGSAYLELSLIGDPVDTLAYRDLIKNSPTAYYQPPRPWRNMAPIWLSSSTCQWIPHNEGQGLRLSGPFNTIPNMIGSTPSSVSVRLRYRTPLTGLLGATSYVGGDRGLTFTLTDSTGVIALRNDPTPALDRAPSYPLGDDHPGAIYLQPKGKA